MAEEVTRWSAYALLVASGSVGALGDVVMNQWVKSGKSQWLFASLLLWVVAVSAFAWLLKTERFPFGGAVVVGLLVHSTAAVVIDRLYFGGRLSLWQWLGIVLALVAMVLIDWGQVPKKHVPSSNLETVAKGETQ